MLTDNKWRLFKYFSLNYNGLLLNLFRKIYKNSMNKLIKGVNKTTGISKFQQWRGLIDAYWPTPKYIHG